MAALGCVAFPRHWSGPVVSAILAFLWAWLGRAYHLALFASINPLAYVFAAASVAGALVLVWQGVVRRRLERRAGAVTAGEPMTGDGLSGTGSLMQDIMKNVDLEEVDDGIYSCLGKADRPSDYDHKASAYDLVVGNRFYNRIVWGNWPSGYREFCRQALASTPGGLYLDAGCGSLVFTASVYAKADNQLIVLLDRSLGMLARGRDRIRRIRGRVPDNIKFLQGNVFDLPFRDHVFDAVASYGVLHIFDDKAGMLAEMERVKRQDGQVFFSSLAGNNTLGEKYLEMLRKAGEVAACHSSESLARALAATPFKYKIDTIGNMAYGRSA